MMAQMPARAADVTSPSLLNWWGGVFFFFRQHHTLSKVEVTYRLACCG